MNTHRKIHTLTIAAVLTGALAAPVFAQEAQGATPSFSPSAGYQSIPPMPENGVMQPNNGVMQPGPMPMAHSAPQASLSLHPNAPLQARQEGDVTYISGGIGDGEVDQLKAEERNYNFKMINSDPTGHYTADTNLVITSRDGREVIRVDNAGPLFLAQLPPGEYRVEATNGSQHETRNVRVSSSGRANVHLIWR